MSEDGRQGAEIRSQITEGKWHMAEDRRQMAKVTTQMTEEISQMESIKNPSTNIRPPTSDFQHLPSAIEEKIAKYEQVMQQLKKSLNTNGWDGRWYKRAFMDDGNTLGSMSNDECRIDSIAQSWSIISNAGDNDKKYISMESLENHLIT